MQSKLDETALAHFGDYSSTGPNRRWMPVPLAVRRRRESELFARLGDALDSGFKFKLKLSLRVEPP